MNFDDLYNTDKRNKPQDAVTVVLPETDDIVALSRSGLPPLIKRAIELASASTKVNEVMSVISELADRAYGKPSQAMDIKSSIDVTHKTSDTDRAILAQYYKHYNPEPESECQTPSMQ